MRQVRTEIELRQGERVGLLFTPRLYVFKGEQGVDFTTDNTLQGMYALYADILYCAALNLWTLEGKDKEEAGFTRVDFHAWSTENPKAFGKAMNIALEALTGKSMKDFIKENEKVAENGANAQNEGAEVKKKKVSFWTMLKSKVSW